ncbi:hypothetical protein CVU75_01540 [Candidatus Dependentiae bacterium HGW-Dependentiae-1]|nr:MAG: hypothetical protein CVU75_01540 [Candidatus Dependentiae bacterium HGW-Dependentiae-1]
MVHVKKFFLSSWGTHLLISTLLLVSSFTTPVRATTGGTVLASASALAGCAAVGRAIYNYAELRSIQMKGRTEHILFGDAQDSARLKLYNWKRNQWSTARAILDNREAVKRELCSAVVNKEIVIFNLNNQIIEQPTWGHVAELIELEKKELKEDLLFLEKKHVTYYRFWPDLFDPFGLLVDIKQACLAEGIDPYGIAGITSEQEARLESRMNGACKTKWWHLFRPNYGKATRIYWREYKLYLRLEALKRIIDDMKAGNDRVYLYQAPLQAQVFVQQQ